MDSILFRVYYLICLIIALFIRLWYGRKLGASAWRWGTWVLY